MNFEKNRNRYLKTSHQSNLTCEEKTKSYYKGEKIMRKFIMVITTVMMMAFLLAGCNVLRTDNKHASVSVTTSDGQSYVFQSANSSLSSSGKDSALRFARVSLNMKTGETVHVTFKCETCGNEQEIDIDKPWSDFIHCDCPEEMDKDGNVREYAAILVSYNQDVEVGETEKTATINR